MNGNNKVKESELFRLAFTFVKVMLKNEPKRQ